jgi:hypothetical protein
MDEQFELFENGPEDWVSRLWKSVPLPARQEVVHLLAQMGQAALQARRVNAATPRKETSDES